VPSLLCVAIDQGSVCKTTIKPIPVSVDPSGFSCHRGCTSPCNAKTGSPAGLRLAQSRSAC